MGTLLKGLHGFKGAYVGSSDAKKIYLGSDKVWPAYDAQIEYLQSTGTQYIYVETSKITKIEIKFQFTNDIRQQRIIAFGEDSSSLCIYENGSGYIATSTNQDWSTNNSISYATLCTVVLDGEAKSTTANSYSWSNSSTANYANNFYLFTTSDLDQFAKAKLYYCKLYNGSTLVYDLIPVRVGQVGYMYDRVSGQLFGNAGTGIFTLGNDIQEVEYLENNSTSYIDTGYKPNNNTRIVCEMQEVSNSSYGRLFGCVGGTTYNSTPLLAVDYETNVTGNLRILMGNDTSWNIISSVTGDYNKHTYEVNKNKFYRDNTLLLTHSEVTYQCITNLAIFSYMRTDGIATVADEFMRGRVYSFKIYESDVLVRDFIPVRTGTTGYLYDKVSCQLFGNAGSGNFTYGPDI